MKYFVLTILTILCATHMMGVEVVTVNRPPVVAKFWGALEVDKVVLEDTATTLFFKVFSRPKSTVIIEKTTVLTDEKGNTYPLKRGIGVVPGEKMTLPETGEADIQLVFPAVSKETKTLNLHCGGNKIWGIQLDEASFRKSIATEIKAVYKKEETAKLLSPELKYGTATLKGRILGYTKDMPGMAQLYLLDPVRGIDYREEFSINEDGSFIITPKAITVTPAVLVFPFTVIKCLAVPGHEWTVVVNPAESTRRKSRLLKNTPSYGEGAYFSGYLSGLQQEILNNTLQCNMVANPYKMAKDMEGKDLNSFKDYVLKNRNNTYKQIDDAHLSPALRMVLKANTDVTTAIALFMGKNIIKTAVANQQKMTPEQRKKYFDTPMEFPNGYFDILKQLKLNDPVALYASEYAYGVHIFSAYKELLSKQIGTKGILFDMINAHNCYMPLTKLTPLTKQQETVLATLPAAYRQLVDNANAQLLKMIEDKKNQTDYHINTVGKDVKADALFKNITDRFKGQALLVDFWATWCAPCRQANIEVAKIKDKLRKQGVVFLYITDNTSPQETWENMIPNLHGEHFKLDATQWKALVTQFHIPGIPFYVIVDKKGNITYSKAGFPGNDVITGELEKASSEQRLK